MPLSTLGPGFCVRRRTGQCNQLQSNSELSRANYGVFDSCPPQVYLLLNIHWTHNRNGGSPRFGSRTRPHAFRQRVAPKRGQTYKPEVPGNRRSG
jgi:hypothetical protein